MSDMGGSSGARRRGNPRPCRDRNRHQNSNAQSRSVRTPDDQSRSVGSLDGKSRGGHRSSSIGQTLPKLRHDINSPTSYPNPSTMHNTRHTRSNNLENNND